MAKSSLFAWALRASYSRPTTGIADALPRSAAKQSALPPKADMPAEQAAPLWQAALFE
jgi:hypothetical protein